MTREKCHESRHQSREGGFVPLEVMALLHEKGATVHDADPHVPTVSGPGLPGGFEMTAIPLTDDVIAADYVVIRPSIDRWTTTWCSARRS